jgi:hypothetical protein
MPAPVIRTGTCFALYGFEVAHAIDLDLAERVLAAPERVRIKAPRRAPSYFEYRPAPLRVTVQSEPLAVGTWRTSPTAEIVVYDFGAVSVGFAIPLAGPLDDLPALAEGLSGNQELAAAARREVDQLVAALAGAVTRPHIPGVVEDYAIFQVAEFAEPCDPDDLAGVYAELVGRVLRAEARRLSAQEVSEATALRLSFGPGDVTVIETDAAFVYDPEAEDVRAVLELANIQLLEMRYLDQKLDETLDGAYEQLARQRGPRLSPPELRRLAGLQLDAAVLFEQVSNALKLIGDQYLVRVYGMAGRRFHLAEWDASIGRKLQTLESIYQKVSDRAATRRMELLEWIIIGLIAVSILLPMFGK